MGACYACVLKVPDSETVSQRVCEDGPVFRTGTVVL
ncbi:dihydroorotate dehydrogenase electron transfer subunit, partial [Burkholderia multivorans]